MQIVDADPILRDIGWKTIARIAVDDLVATGNTDFDSVEDLERVLQVNRSAFVANMAAPLVLAELRRIKERKTWQANGTASEALTVRAMRRRTGAPPVWFRFGPR